MPGSTYSSNLKIELMTTGENSGTWGDVTNTNLGTALEQAIIGYGNPDYTSDANLTITITNSNASQAARCLVLNVTSVFGALTATRELIVPTSQKQYIVQNNTTGGQSITVKTSAGTGITVPNGRKAHLYVNGTDVIQMFDFVDINGGAIDGTPIGASSASTGTFTTLGATGNVTLGDADTDTITQAASYVTGTQLKSAKTATNTLSLAAYDVDGTAYTNLITLTAGNTPTLALTSTGVGTINNMSIGATTASTGAFTTLSANSTVTLSGGTENGVAYLNGSKVLTTGSALVFDGTNFGVGSASLSSASGRVDVTINGTSSSMVSFGTGGTRRGYMIHDGTDLTTANEQAAGALRWVTSAGEAMRIATATGGVNAVGIGYTTLTSVGNNGLAVLGNVGIGTSSPGVKLDVAGAIRSTAVTPIFYLNNGTTQHSIANSSGAMPFTIDGTEGMRLTSTSLYTASGISVGIGTSSPLSKLSVAQGADGFDQGITLSRAGANRGTIFLNASNDTLNFGRSTATSMTLDASSNLGLGVTPSANAGQRTLSIANYTGTFSSLTMGSNGSAAGYVGYNMGNTSTNTVWRYLTADTGSALWFAGDEMRFMLFPLGTAAATTSGTQAMTLDASGRLGIGTTSMASQLHVKNANGNGGGITSDNYGMVQVESTFVGTNNAGLNASFIARNYYGFSQIMQWENFGVRIGSRGTANSGAGAVAFTYGNDSLGMTLDNGGNLLVGKTSFSGTSGTGAFIAPDGRINVVNPANTNAFTTYELYSTNAGAYRFYVGSAGTVFATNTTITAISDQRLKENIRDLDDGLDVVMALKPRKFDWKEGKGAGIKNARGFIAQEFEQVLPDMIEEWKDSAPEGEEPYKAINANLIPTLVKAIQELKAEFDAYKASHP